MNDKNELFEVAECLADLEARQDYWLDEIESIINRGSFCADLLCEEWLTEEA